MAYFLYDYLQVLSLNLCFHQHQLYFIKMYLGNKISIENLALDFAFHSEISGRVIKMENFRINLSFMQILQACVHLCVSVSQSVCFSMQKPSRKMSFTLEPLLMIISHVVPALLHTKLVQSCLEAVIELSSYSLKHLVCWDYSNYSTTSIVYALLYDYV